MASVTVTVQQDVMADRRRMAAELRDEFSRKGTLVVNIVSSPGAGKTSLLQAMARHWNGRCRIACLVGDIATERDAERLRPLMPAEQLTTGGACHLEIPLVRSGLDRLGDDPLEFLFIENIGNLVCPASWDLGEHLRVVLLSSTEGDDKPAKYPKMFRTSQVLVITKSDLLPYVPFSVASAIQDAHQIQPQLSSFVTSALRGEGIDNWCSFLEDERRRMLESVLLTSNERAESP